MKFSLGLAPKSLCLLFCPAVAVALLLAVAPSRSNAQQATPLTSAHLSADDLRKAPATILILRHAEKPAPELNSPDLTQQGFTRARALPRLFTAEAGTREPARLPRPDFLFATARSARSNRPVETATPLAEALHLELNHAFEDHDAAGLARELLSGRYAGKVVLVCWHHGEIPNLAAALGAQNVPAPWPAEAFDRVWRLDYADAHAGTPPRLQVLPQHLLPGDPAS